MDPVIFWFNGGPGCSSMGGMLEGLGPFNLDVSGSKPLRENEFSWNKVCFFSVCRINKFFEKFSILQIFQTVKFGLLKGQFSFP